MTNSRFYPEMWISASNVQDSLYKMTSFSNLTLGVPMNTEKQMSAEENVKKFAALIKDVKFAMLTTTTAGGGLHSCPMTTQEMEFDGSLWFFINKSSQKITEIKIEPQVNLSYAKPEDNIYVSVSGYAQLVEDLERAKKMWSPIYKAWFKGGLEDPDLGLLRVDVEKAEYWDSPHSGVAQLLGFAKAMFTGQRPAKIGEHEKINLQ
jgi:general stress protein 26